MFYFLDGMNGDDAGMIQGRDGLRFALEALSRERIAREQLRQDLESDLPVQPAIFGNEDLAHAAFSKRLDDLVMADDVTRLHLAIF